MIFFSSTTTNRESSFAAVLVAFLLFIRIPTTAGDDGMCPPKDCCELECCGVGTSWDGNGCHADSIDSIGFDFSFPEGYELGCRMYSCCEEDCCVPPETIYDPVDGYCLVNDTHLLLYANRCNNDPLAKMKVNFAHSFGFPTRTYAQVRNLGTEVNCKDETVVQVDVTPPTGVTFTSVQSNNDANCALVGGNAKCSTFKEDGELTFCMRGANNGPPQGIMRAKITIQTHADCKATAGRLVLNWLCGCFRFQPMSKEGANDDANIQNCKKAQFGSWNSRVTCSGCPTCGTPLSVNDATGGSASLTFEASLTIENKKKKCETCP
jgi:hypothetical protein